MTKTAKTRPVHPGRIIRQEFLEPAGLTQQQLAAATGLSRMMISHLLNGRRGITAETALRLEAALGMSAATWLSLQNLFDLETAQVETGKTIRHETFRLDTATAHAY